MGNILRSHSRKYTVLSLIAIVILVGASVVYGINLTEKRGTTYGPHVYGTLDFINGMAPQSNHSSKSVPINASVQAFISLPNGVDASPNGTGIPYIVNNSYATLGATSADSSGYVSYNLNSSFYGIAHAWNLLLMKMKSPQRIPIIFEINYYKQIGNEEYIYTFTHTYFFLPATVNNSTIPNINITGNYTYYKPSVVVPLSNNTNISAAGEQTLSILPPKSPGNSIAWEWKVANDKSLSNINFPLLIFFNSTALSLSNGYFIGSAALGAIGTSLKFTSAQGFSNNSTNVNNIKNWNFESTTATTAQSPLGFHNWSSVGYPAPRTQANESVSYVYIQGVTIQLVKYQLYEIVNGIPYAINSFQVQEYLENATIGGGFSVWKGYLPSWSSQLFEYLFNNVTKSIGSISYGQQLNITPMQTRLSTFSNTQWQDIVNTVNFGLAGLGVAVAVAATLEAVSLGTASIGAAMAIMTSFVNLAWSIVGACSSIIISSMATICVYFADLADYYNQTMNVTVYIEPATINLDNTTMQIASPYIVLS